MRGRPNPARLRITALAIAAVIGGANLNVAMAADPPSGGAPAAQPFAEFVASAARRFGVPASWIWAVMRAESAGDPQAVSSAGARGLMQIMPATWAYLRRRYGLGTDPFDPHDNIAAGAAWLRELHDRYGSPGFLAAYNAGRQRYDAHLASGRPLPAETQIYLAKLASARNGTGAARPFFDPLAWTRAALFPSEPRRSSAITGPDTQSPQERSASALFIPLSGQAPPP